MNADGSDPFRLTDNASDEFGPVFSPDGKHILYLMGGNFTNNIWIMDSDGSNKSQLTFSGTDWGNCWSPDGRRIAFESYRSGNGDIWIMDADGRNAVQLTRNSAKELAASWSPDGRSIVFESTRNGNGDIYVVKV
jgi:TolB protein